MWIIPLVFCPMGLSLNASTLTILEMAISWKSQYCRRLGIPQWGWSRALGCNSIDHKHPSVKQFPFPCYTTTQHFHVIQVTEQSVKADDIGSDDGVHQLAIPANDKRDCNYNSNFIAYSMCTAYLTDYPLFMSHVRHHFPWRVEHSRPVANDSLPVASKSCIDKVLCRPVRSNMQNVDRIIGNLLYLVPI